MMPASKSVRPVHFLLVEDDEDHAGLISRALRDNRVANTVSHVVNGEQAMAFVNRHSPYEDADRPDVILLDLNLPRMDGHEVLAAIKSDPDLCSIPVVVLTTSHADADRSRAYSAHANSYLVKPLNFESFQALVQELKMYWTVWNEPAPATA
ncbi:MAG: response regulator [Phycisphaeraceae bacterium]|nr:MAG: response regulator [Phycisphaeraceae bacterium]